MILGCFIEIAVVGAIVGWCKRRWCGDKSCDINQPCSGTHPGK